MEDPTFRLEGIVRSHNETEDFEGPLTLILLLLSRNRIEIRDVRISDILQQYLAYLDEMKSMDLDIASEFVAMASHLTYIKAKTLLADDEETVTELEALLSSLEELQRRDGYTRIRFAAEFLAACRARGEGYFTRPAEPLPKGGGYTYSHTAEELKNALFSVLDKNAGETVASPRIAGIPQKIEYPVSRKAEEILGCLRARGMIGVRELLSQSASRTELVATFLALLELCKTGSIILVGSGEDLDIGNSEVSLLQRCSGPV